MKITRAVVPSLFTVLNIFCGFRSLLHTSQGDFRLAAWFIILAGIFDVLDGVMARITRSSSDFGVEFDSLSDVVSFGVAPSFLVYTACLHTQQGVGMLVSAMPMIFGAMRLARFNAQLVGYDKDYFKGLPIPGAAITLAAFILQYDEEGAGVRGLEASLLVPMVVILSLLMVSTIKYDPFPKFSRKGIRQHPLRFTVGVVAATVLIVTRGEALFPFLVFYVATGPLRTVVQFIQHALHPAAKSVQEKDPEVTRVDV
ncbi:MAG: CDP-diacylglycerol--serine O-phosphatidyltransferase [Ignavibacteriae bacterium]|nr:CDP-diacylglycerol--serine O-phosphatidyltransferase [Ignavibacteria bacterium]MBI3364981.1 CDP-diacylglycerol--serine O-phosphatidyltransferase [Ignavibacteriota bacterium]